MSDLIAMQDRPPRFVGGDNWARRLQIGLLIDWLDSRPGSASTDTGSLRRKADRGDEVALAAAGLSGRLGRALHAGELAFDSRTDHDLEYLAHSGIEYHAHIAGHLQDDELRIGEEVYTELSAAAPECLSGAVNLAELERRRGHESDAIVRLERALSLARSSAARRYGVPDARWIVVIRCALARLAGSVGDAAELLESARRDRLVDLTAQLRAYASWEDAAIAASQAFSVASAEQRIVLHAALRMAPVSPKPPPAAHAQFDAIIAAERLVSEAAAESERRKQPPAAPEWKPGGLLGHLLRRLTRRP